MANKTKGYHKNPRKISDIDLNNLELWMKELGDLSGIVVDKNSNEIIGGNQRSKIIDINKATKEIVSEYDQPTETGTIAEGYIVFEGERFAYREVEWDEEKCQKANLIANKAGGDWDFNMLNNKFPIDLLKDVGFEMEELGLEDFDDESSPEDVEDDFEHDEKEEIKTDIVLGDVFEIGKHWLICGDSTNKDHVDKLLDGNEPYLMITDPPYGVEYDANWRNELEINGKVNNSDIANSKVANDDNPDWYEAWELSPSKVSYIYHAAWFSGVVQNSLEKADFNVRSQIIWAKSSIVLSRGHYHWKHEPCWYAVKKNSTAQWAGDRKQNTIWEIERPKKSETGHSTQKPVECMAKPMRNHIGDVYDPFLGSGTTMVAAEKLDRVCYGIEFKPEHCYIIIRRMFKEFDGIQIKKNGVLLNKDDFS